LDNSGRSYSVALVYSMYLQVTCIGSMRRPSKLHKKKMKKLG